MTKQKRKKKQLFICFSSSEIIPFLTSVHWAEAAIDVNQLTQFQLLSFLASWALDSESKKE